MPAHATYRVMARCTVCVGVAGVAKSRFNKFLSVNAELSRAEGPLRCCRLILLILVSC